MEDAVAEDACALTILARSWKVRQKGMIKLPSSRERMIDQRFVLVSCAELVEWSSP